MPKYFLRDTTKRFLYMVPQGIAVLAQMLQRPGSALWNEYIDRYHYLVLLETFVEMERFAGTCYRAANWACVGQTQGRGKLGDHRLGQVQVKTVWVDPLAKDFRAQLSR